jgi:hypothetical protein
MGFFKWLFAKRCACSDKKAQTESFLDETKGLNRVHKWCRAGKRGRRIICPHCGGDTMVYQFSWSNMKCPHCRAMVDKYDWFLGANDG